MPMQSSQPAPSGARLGLYQKAADDGSENRGELFPRSLYFCLFLFLPFCLAHHTCLPGGSCWDSVCVLEEGVAGIEIPGGEGGR